MRKSLLALSVVLALLIVALAAYHLIETRLLGGPTTAQAALKAIGDCGISPSDIAWRVEGGTFYIGSKTPPGTGPQIDLQCLITWAQENNIRLGFIGWEQTK